MYRVSFVLWRVPKRLILFFVLGVSPLFAQQQGYKPQIHIPKTPEVSAMEKFIDNPVNLNTGLHDVTIPIYNLSVKDISIPIALKYHSSGMKVDELASNVGLGWSLDVEGAVSATVAGIPDTGGDWPNAYYSKIKNGGFGTYHGPFNVPASVYEVTEDPLDLYNVPAWGADIQFLRGALKGTRDSEPDIFFFSYPGGSGKFFIDETGNFQTIPHQKVKIEKVLTSGVLTGYKVTDLNGIVYEFLDKEESSTTSSSSCDGTNASPINLAQPTFKLTRIASTNGSIVNFYYTSYNYSVDNQNSYSRTGPGGGADIMCMTTYTPNITQPCVSFSSTNFAGAKRLDSLTTNYGDKIVFNYSNDNRLDLPETKRMTGVSVYKKQIPSSYQLIKSFELNNSTYFHATGTPLTGKLNYRLKLSSVKEAGKPSHVFQYDETEIPPRFAFGTDHWGYYNGASNTNLLPAEPQNGFEAGANREANFEKSKACLLTKIIYPTGGTLDFEYEQNNYYSEGGEFYYTSASATLSSQPNATVTAQFTIPQNSVLHKFTWTNDDDGINTANDYCKIRITGPNNFNRFFSNASAVNGERIFLLPGTYTIEIETAGSSMDGTITASWLAQQIMSAGNRLTGGVRIKKARNCTGSSCVESYYSYTKGDGTSSSGQSLYNPVYTYIATKRFLECIGLCVSQPYVEHYCDVYTQSSSSLTPLANTQGSHVVYDEVTVSNTSGATLGKTVYKFIVDKSANSSFGYYPFPPVITYDWLNGLAREVTVYAYNNGQFTKVKRTLNNYVYSSVANRSDTLSNQASVFGAKVGLQNYPHGCATNCVLNLYGMPDIEFAVASYKLISSWHYLNATTEINYSNNGQDSLVNTTEYFYDNPDHIQLTRTKQYESDGSLITSTTKYPLDYAHGVNTVIDRMHDKNMVPFPVEQRKEMGSGSSAILLDSKLFVYKNMNSSTVIDKVKSFTTSVPVLSTSFAYYNGSAQDSRYDDEITIEAYDGKNNPLQFVDRSGVRNAYIWDSELNQLMATVENATTDQAAFTSFENASNGNWIMGSNSRVNSASAGGDYNYLLQSGSISKAGLDPAVKYSLSFWAKPGASPTVTCNQIISSSVTQVMTDWYLHTYIIQNSSIVQISGSGNIDELRLHPEKSKMQTYTNKPGVGVICTGDINNVFSYFEYDEVGRLKYIRDFKKNILKRYTYNYQITSNSNQQ